MGTRADFYVGIGADAEWMGSIAWDGYKWAENPNTAIMLAATENAFRLSVAAELKDRRDATFPHMGWPWPWEDSNATDYAYCYHEGSVKVFYFGEPLGQEDAEKSLWPDMTEHQNVTYGPRSGVVIMGFRN